MLTRIKFDIPRNEYDLLVKLAGKELRNPYDQLRHILRQELERRGLLPAELSAQVGTPTSPAEIAETVNEHTPA